MTTTITIELTSTNPDSTWGDVMKCISAALSPDDKRLRLVDTLDYPGRIGTEYRFESVMNSYNGVSGTAVLRVEHAVPTGYGAVVKAVFGKALYTRLGADRWVSSATGAHVPDDTIKSFLHDGATVLFEGVEQ